MDYKGKKKSFKDGRRGLSKEVGVRRKAAKR